MTKRLVLLIAVTLAFLFVGTVSFAETNAVNRVSEGMQNAGSAINGAIRETTDNIGDAFNGRDDEQRDPRIDGSQDRDGMGTRTQTNPNSYLATRTNTPYEAARTNTAVIWTVLAVAGAVIVGLVWYYSAQARGRYRD